jgi:hypothetical protein
LPGEAIPPTVGFCLPALVTHKSDLAINQFVCLEIVKTVRLVSIDLPQRANHPVLVALIEVLAVLVSRRWPWSLLVGRATFSILFMWFFMVPPFAFYGIILDAAFFAAVFWACKPE